MLMYVCFLALALRTFADQRGIIVEISQSCVPPLFLKCWHHTTPYKEPVSTEGAAGTKSTQTNRPLTVFDLGMASFSTYDEDNQVPAGESSIHLQAQRLLDFWRHFRTSPFYVPTPHSTQLSTVDCRIGLYFWCSTSCSPVSCLTPKYRV